MREHLGPFCPHEAAMVGTPRILTVIGAADEEGASTSNTIPSSRLCWWDPDRDAQILPVPVAAFPFLTAAAGARLVAAALSVSDGIELHCIRGCTVMT